MFEIRLPSDTFDAVKKHIAGSLFVARLKGNDGESFILVFEPAAEQSVQSDLLPCGHDGSEYKELSHLVYGCAVCAATSR